MSRIIEKTELAARVFRYRVDSPDIANKAQAGQFVILRLHEKGERIPVTIADWDRENGTLTFFVQAVGKTSIEMSRMQAGDVILDLAGPLGNPCPIAKFGTVVLVGGGFGIAAIHPIARAFTEAGNRTVSILGCKSRDVLILEKEMRAVSNEVRVVTEDGSLGRRGRVTDELQALIGEGVRIDLVVAVGPVVMMQAVSEMTRPLRIPTRVSLNPIMIDGTGMCGACRVVVDGQMKFACVDGPEFDAHKVDFATLIQRLKTYQPEEKAARERFVQTLDSDCRIQQELQPSSSGTDT